MQLIKILNITLGITLAFCTLFALSSYVTPTDLPKIATKNTVSIENNEESPIHTEEFGKNVLALNKNPAALQLPDLRHHLTFFGKNDRPDNKEELLYVGLRGSDQTQKISVNQRLYLLYELSPSGGKYLFSPQNSPTSLYVELSLDGDKAHFSVSMQTPSGQLVNTPELFANFSLPESDYLRQSGKSWQMGDMRVDGGLLVRQKARWYGKDRFLEEHGGEEYAHIGGKERIDFGDEERHHFCYATAGDYLVWSAERWQEASGFEDTTGLPLLQIKKVDERIMRLKLWDESGRATMTLHLAKSMEMWTPQQIEQSFKFVGSRTRKQSILEINEERLFLSPFDWLIQTKSGWQKLATEQEIEQYVNGMLNGELFIFDGIKKRGGQQCLVGHLFNRSRSVLQEIELPLQRSEAPISTNSRKAKREEIRIPPPLPLSLQGKKSINGGKLVPPPSMRKVEFPDGRRG